MPESWVPKLAKPDADPSNGSEIVLSTPDSAPDPELEKRTATGVEEAQAKAWCVRPNPKIRRLTGPMVVLACSSLGSGR